MSERQPDREPPLSPEDEGIPDLGDGTPAAYWAEDPQMMSLPGDEPLATDDFGVTADEQWTGENLDQRLAREEADVGIEPAERPARPAGRLIEEDEGAHPDRETDAVAAEASDDLAGRSAEESAMRVEPDEPAEPPE